MNKIKLFLMSLFLAILFTASGLAKPEQEVVRLGVLSPLGTTQEEFQNGFDELRDFLSLDKISFDEEHTKKFLGSIVNERRLIVFNTSLMSAIMSLKSSRIDEFLLPETVASYLMSQNKSFVLRFETDILSSRISFGFREDSQELKNEFDEAIRAMKDDGTLERLQEKYIKNFDDRSLKSIESQKFKNAPEIRIALTGDMPPVDMFAGDGKPAGFNTAVIAEIGKRLGKNIRFINTEAGGRSAALFSGRADVVFWYITKESRLEVYDFLEKIFNDVPSGVILSEPYYFWDREFIIGVKQRR